MSLLTHLNHLIDNCSHFHHQVRPHQQMFDFYRCLLYLLLYYGINTLCAIIISLNNLLLIFRAILNILAINYITLILPLSFWRLSLIIFILLWVSLTKALTLTFNGTQVLGVAKCLQYNIFLKLPINLTFLLPNQILNLLYQSLAIIHLQITIIISL